MAMLARVLLALSALWAVAALAAEALSARRVKHWERAASRGSGTRGVLYGFTAAMAPAKKESISRHPVSFAAGMLLHLGVAAAFVTAAVSSSVPAALPAMRSALAAGAAVGLAACLGLLLRRLVQEDLRRISLLDDYAASLMIAVFLTSTLAFLAQAMAASAYWIIASVLLAYLPLGKLRHAVFFFLARGDLSRRLGLRGVYPPAAGAGGHDARR